MAVQQQLVAQQGLLEGRAHESVTRSRMSEYREVNAKESEVNDEWPDDETSSAGSKVFVEDVL
jgi:hypothetical protein